MYCDFRKREDDKIQISLPDQLAEEAQLAGLLSSDRVELWIREQLNTQRVEELFSAMDRMAAAQARPELRTVCHPERPPLITFSMLMIAKFFNPLGFTS